MMTELEVMERARMYMERLANGINPLTGEIVPDTEVIQNVRISRCLFYVADILRQVIANGGISQPKKSKKLPFDLEYDVRKQYPLSDAPIPVSEITKRINQLIDTDQMFQLKYKSITQWLIQAGFLKETLTEDGKNRKEPTDVGNDMGIFSEQRMGAHGVYTVILYTAEAQQFLMDNLDAIIEINNTKPGASASPTESQEKP